MTLFIALLVTFGLLILAHYLPWSNWFSLRWQRVHVVVNYVIGVTAFMIPLTFYFVIIGQAITALTVWAFVAVAGAAVAGSYALDWWVNRLHEKRLENAWKN